MATVQAACKDCRFSVLKQANPAALFKSRVCYLNPPNVFVVQTSPNQVGMHTAHPVVADADMCFQFEATAEAVERAKATVPPVKQ